MSSFLKAFTAIRQGELGAKRHDRHCVFSAERI